jgi:hypothetical protein
MAWAAGCKIQKQLPGGSNRLKRKAPGIAANKKPLVNLAATGLAGGFLFADIPQNQMKRKNQKQENITNFH